MPEITAHSVAARRELSPMALHIQRVLNEFDACNVSIADWARLHGFSLSNVYRVLRGEQACKRGEAYRIAVTLGLKSGSILTPEQLDQKLRGETLDMQVQNWLSAKEVN